MKIEVFYFEGCPNHAPTVERVKDSLRSEGLDFKVIEVNVADEAAAKSSGFLGSPTVRINDLDIEPGARFSKHAGLGCRTYADENKRTGVPPSSLVRAALREAASVRA